MNLRIYESTNSRKFFSLVVMCLVITLFACHKEELIQEEVHTSEVELSDEEIQERAIQIAERRKLPNSTVTLRDGQTYSLDEAEDLLDHSLNYSYCRPQGNYESVEYYTDTGATNYVSTDTLNETEVDALIDEIECFLSDAYHNQSSALSKDPISVDLKFVTVGSSQKLQMHFMIGVGAQTAGSGYPYSSGDYWNLAFDAGLCFSIPPPPSDEDAVDQWRRDLNLNEAFKLSHKNYTKYIKITRSLYMISGDQGAGYTPGYEVPDDILYPEVRLFNTDIVNVNDPNSGDYVIDYWCAIKRNDQMCLAPNEMNYHYNAMLSGFNNLKTSSEIYVRFEQGYDFFTIGGGTYNLYHTSFSIVGEVITLPTQEDKVPLPLPEVLGC